MIKTFWTFIYFLVAVSVQALAQEKFTVRLCITNDGVGQHIGEDFYVAGSFNSWQPGKLLAGKFPEIGQTVTLEIQDVSSGLLEYQFTRGHWQTVATDSMGALKQPFQAFIRSDTLLYVGIEGWRDDFPSSTASPQVSVLDSAFYFPSLNVKRRVWLYLPKDYGASTTRYPVIYMHDGDDLFDEATSKGRIGPVEWRVDETIDQSPYDAIVVAVAQAEDIPQRQNEYFVYPTGRFGDPVGKHYMADIVGVLKPYVDQHFRTLGDKRHTAMVGSSAGALLTFYAGLTYPEVFGTLGVLSPSFWLDQNNVERAIRHVASVDAVASQCYFLYGGGNENRMKPDGSYVRMDEDLRGVGRLLREQTGANVEISINPEGRHGAWYWQRAFPRFFEWWAKRLDK